MTDIKILRDHSLPCKHKAFRTCYYRDDKGAACPGGKKIILVAAGSMARSWVCLSCGDDHCGAACDNPDFNCLTFYTIKEVAS